MRVGSPSCWYSGGASLRLLRGADLITAARSWLAWSKSLTSLVQWSLTSVMSMNLGNLPNTSAASEDVNRKGFMTCCSWQWRRQVRAGRLRLALEPKQRYGCDES
eukprot:4957395-Pyramimonas_sp.AAC.1